MKEKAHNRCGYITTLLIWNICKKKSPEWGRTFLGNMATKSRAWLKKNPSIREQARRLGVKEHSIRGSGI